MKLKNLFAAAALLLVAGRLYAAPIVNSPLTITKQVRVQVIDVANTDGSSAAPLFGSAAEQAIIFSRIDTIWAQAGIDVDFKFRSGTYNSTFANTGTTGSNNPRPTGDLNTIVSQGSTAGVLDPDPKVINLFMVRIVPGFPQTSDNTSNGLAFVNGNGITAWAGPNLTSFDGGQDVIASVISHEIGHNLGLDHIVEAENLMQAGGSANSGERLNATQITTAQSSSLVIAIPEPASAALLLIGAVGILHRRRRAA